MCRPVHAAVRRARCQGVSQRRLVLYVTVLLLSIRQEVGASGSGGRGDHRSNFLLYIASMGQLRMVKHYTSVSEQLQPHLLLITSSVVVFPRSWSMMVDIAAVWW